VRDLLSVALSHAARDWRVLPLHSPLAGGGCSCRRVCRCEQPCGVEPRPECLRCRTPGKHPRIRDWTEEATTDEAQIRKWWGMWPEANIGIATGRASGLWVLDVDPRHGGDETLAALEGQHGALPDTVEVLTQGAGRHLYWQSPPDFEVRNIQKREGEESPLGPGLDLRGDGGLVVAPGSRGEGGRGWEWEIEHHPDSVAVLESPAWLLALVRRAVAPGSTRIAGPVEAPERIPHGRQHNTLVSLAGAMRRNGLAPREIEAALWEINTGRCERPGTREAIHQIAHSMVRYRPAVEEREPPPDGAPCDASETSGAGPAVATAPEEDAENPPAVARMNGRRKGKVIIPKPRLISAADLMRLELPSPQWAVPEVLPEGVSILAGKPKKGKSWLALQTCLAVAAGGRALGKVPVEQGQVLYLALEDSRRRLKGRIAFLLEREAPPEDLTLAAAGDWTRIGEGGKIEIEEWLSAHDRARLVVIDTFGRFRVPPKQGANVYDEEYREMSSLKALADQASCALMVIHHLRKMDADDPFDTISGSLGLTAAADAILILQRDRGKGEARLHLTGRDVEDRELALQWESHAGWTLMGEAAEYERTQEQAQVIEALRVLGRPSSPAEISRATGIPRDTVKMRMWRMAEAGVLVSDSGVYRPSLKQYSENGVTALPGGEEDPFLSTE
jgi:hypothetical protein